jgi:hypothetical protein
VGGIVALALFSCAGLGCYIACEKGLAAPEGTLLGWLFGPLGVVVVALLPDQKRRPQLAIAVAILVVSLSNLHVAASRFNDLDDPHARQRATSVRVLRTLEGRQVLPPPQEGPRSARPSRTPWLAGSRGFGPDDRLRDPRPDGTVTVMAGAEGPDEAGAGEGGSSRTGR